MSGADVANGCTRRAIDNDDRKDAAASFRGCRGLRNWNVSSVEYEESSSDRSVNSGVESCKHTARLD
eukprot:1564093-Rhodomonas_salina.2